MDPARSVPTLPFQSAEPEARARRLERAREQYRYDTSYGGMPFVAELPLVEHFPPRYLAKGAEITLALSANRAASSLSGWGADALSSIRGAVGGFFDRGDVGGGLALARTAGTPLRTSLDGWAGMFTTLPQPRSLPHWREDWCFAWQRLAGPCPIVLRRVDRLDRALAVDDADLARALGRPATLAAALATHSLYVADYSVFSGIPGGVTDGAQKHLMAPIALYVADPALKGALAPLAIQTAGREGGPETLYRTTDRDWLLARTVVQIADENMQGVLVHLGWCHMIIQRFILAAHRQLAPEHPLMQLFAPHFELTLAVNQVARSSVVDPGGVQDRLLAPVLEAQLSALDASLRTLDLDSLDPEVDFARRGVAERDALPLYPFRDDSLPLWKATRAFVEGYVRLYYQSDEDVRRDTELAAMVREVGAADGGQLPRLIEGVSLSRIEDVVALVARVIFRATTYHAAINDSNYDWAGYVPNMPTAGFSVLPPRGEGGEEALAAMLPTTQLGWETITATYQVAQLHTNRFGAYPAGTFRDERVQPLLDTLAGALGDIERQITERNTQRPIPYDYLLPSRITASINA